MQQLYRFFLLFIIAPVFAACGNSEEFLIKCDIEGLGNKGLEMVYVNRSLQRRTFHPVNGKVTLSGVSTEPTLVEVYVNDNTLLFSCIARNGDDLSVKMKLDDPASLVIKGNPASEQWARFVAANDSLLRRGSPAEVNALVEREVVDNPASVASAAILLCYFRAPGHELKADSLINVLTPAVRSLPLLRGFSSLVGTQVSTTTTGKVQIIDMPVARDTTGLRFYPGGKSYSLLVFTDGAPKPRENVRILRDLFKKYPKRRLAIYEMALMGDSASWSLSIKGDSARWMQGWLPGGSGAPGVRQLALPDVPYYVLCDSLAVQVYRGKQLQAVVDTLEVRLKGVTNTDAPDADAPLAEPAPPAAAMAPATVKGLPLPESRPHPKGAPRRLPSRLQ